MGVTRSLSIKRRRGSNDSPSRDCRSLPKLALRRIDVALMSAPRARLAIAASAFQHVKKTRKTIVIFQFPSDLLFHMFLSEVKNPDVTLRIRFTHTHTEVHANGFLVTERRKESEPGK